MPIYQLDEHEYWFPPVSEALEDPPGLLALGGDLSIPRLLHAYQSGIFPWYTQGEPILWWAPSPRMVMAPNQIHISNSMRKFIRKTSLTVTFDHAFERVIGACSATLRNGQDSADSWIIDDMQAAYTQLYHAGYAHSVEVWRGQELVGGLYGIALGRMFFGESMFSTCDNSSKLAFITLAKQLTEWDFLLIDCQMHTNHLASLGAGEIDMQQFQEHLEANLVYGLDSSWRLVVAHNP